MTVKMMHYEHILWFKTLSDFNFVIHEHFENITEMTDN